MDSDSSLSHDLDATEKVPTDWLPEEPATLDLRPTPAPATLQRKPIPSIVRRDAVKPLPAAVADRIERASRGDTPPPPAKAIGLVRLAKATMPPPAKPAIVVDDFAARPTIPLEETRKRVITPPKVEIDPVAFEPTVAVEAAGPVEPPAPMHLEAPAPVVDAPLHLEPSVVAPVEAVAPPVEEPAAPVEDAAPLHLDVHAAVVSHAVDPADLDVEPLTLIKPLDAVAPVVEPVRKAPARKNHNKTARRRPAVRAAEPVAAKPVAAPIVERSFGAGMLAANKVRAKAAPVVEPVLASGSTFGAGMLQAQKSRKGLVMVVLLAAAAIVIAYLVTRG